MKTKNAILISAALLLLISIVTFGDDKYVPKPNEELFGTWINMDMQPQKSENFDGGYKDYTQLSDSEPTGGEGTEQIMTKWTDAAGDIWYKTFGKVSKGKYSGIMFEAITKISKSGKVKESVVIAPVNFYSPDWLWQGVDPSLHNYSISYRAEDKYVAKANEELYGTWTNEKNGGDLFHPQKVVVTQDGYTAYSKISDSDSLFSWKLSIDSKWTDSDGNIWYKILGIGDGSWKGYKSQELYKLSESGTIMERAWTDVGNGAYDPSMYPTKIDPMIPSYRILYRLGN